MLSRDNARVRCVEAAIDVIRAEGLSGFSTRLLARRTGLTQPAMYRHFDGRDALVRAALRQARDAFLRRLEGANAEEDPLRRLLRMLQEFCAFSLDEPRLFDALFLAAPSSGLPVLSEAARARRGTIFGALAGVVRAAMRDGKLRVDDPDEVALLLAAQARGLVALHRRGRFASRREFEQVFRRSLERTMRGLRAV